MFNGHRIYGLQVVIDIRGKLLIDIVQNQPSLSGDGSNENQVIARLAKAHTHLETAVRLREEAANKLADRQKDHVNR